MKLSMLYNKNHIRACILLASMATSLLSGASHREQTRQRLRARLEKKQHILPDIKAPTSAEIKAYQTSPAANHKLASALVLQAHIMHTAEKYIAAEHAVENICIQQKKQLLPDPKSPIVLPGISIVLPHRSAEALALVLRYEILLASYADHLMDEHPTLITEVESTLPMHLASQDTDIQFIAQTLDTKIKVAKAKKLKYSLSEQTATLLTAPYSLDLKHPQPELTQYYSGWAKHFETYDAHAQYSLIKYHEWISKAENMLSHYQKNAEIIQKHYEHIRASLERHKGTPLYTFFNSSFPLPDNLHEDLNVYFSKPLPKSTPKKSSAHSSDEWLDHLPQLKKTPVRQARKKSAQSPMPRANKSIATPVVELPQIASSELTSDPPPLTASSCAASSCVTSSCAVSPHVTYASVASSGLTLPSSSSPIGLVTRDYDVKTDGSYVKDKTNTIITIRDPKNDAVIKLFRIHKPTAQHVEGVSFAPNINHWMANPDQELEHRGYKTKGHTNYIKQKNYPYFIKIHTFGLAVDDCIAQCGIAQKTQDRINPEQTNIMILVPGSFSYTNNKQKLVEKIGLFTYILNPKTNTLFHRMFHTYKAKTLIEEYKKNGTWNVNIDQLHEH